MSSKCNNFASEEALKIAKTNVEKYYAVVGILERWQDSLQLFEVGPCLVKSLTSEAIPSATQFFMRAYKISHFPGL